MDPNDTRGAPEPLRVVQEFVNTRSNLRGEDLFDNLEETSEWLVSNDMLPPDGALTDDERLHLISFRESLREILTRHNSGETEARITPENVSAQVNVSLSPSGDPILTPAQPDGAGYVKGRLFTIIVDSAANGDWNRLKACRNEDCHWAFYDSSKNRSATWCNMQTCGTRHKMRAYRKRKSG